MTDLIHDCRDTVGAELEALVASASSGVAALVDTALDQSADAAFASLHAMGGDNADCGGAWVVVTARKGRKALVAALAAHSIRVDRHHAGGLAVYILRNLGCQSRAPFEAGCRAFAAVLSGAGYPAHVYSYAD